MNQGIFPKYWKTSYIQPIFKKGNKHDVTNYRPISQIGSVAKIFDSIVASKLSEFLLSHIIQEQHGFVKDRSTITNLLLYSDYISKALEQSHQVNSIYLDFSKAFNTVHHHKFLRKLWEIGIHSNVFLWLKSYLLERSQLVRLRGYVSDEVNVTSGVPQGSHLGPLLFIIFINDITRTVKNCKVLIYADDVKLYRIVSSPLNSSAIQRDLVAIQHWATTNDLRLNILKCQIISFTKSAHPFAFGYELYGEPLQRVSSISDLGIICDQRLSFREHLDDVSKASRTLGFSMRNTREFLSGLPT